MGIGKIGHFPQHRQKSLALTEARQVGTPLGIEKTRDPTMIRLAQDKQGTPERPSLLVCVGSVQDPRKSFEEPTVELKRHAFDLPYLRRPVAQALAQGFDALTPDGSFR
jgi:hypothetical protein